MNKPSIHRIKKIKIPQIKDFSINNVAGYYKSGLVQPVFKVDVTFEAGESYSENPLVPSMTCNMLLEGTKKLTSKEFSEKIDFLGAEISCNTTFEISSLSLICLNKHAKEALQLFVSCLNEPRFDENDFRILKENLYNKFLIDLENVNLVARRELLKNILSGHPYGNIPHHKHFEELDIKQLEDLFNRLYKSNNAVMFVSGYIDDDLLLNLKETLNLSEATIQKPFIPEIANTVAKKLFIEKKNSVQNAIRIGKLLISRNHQDFIPLSITIAVLGGYFGSRLMKSLREEKGYTYGIHSFIYSHKKLNMLVIATEVASEYVKDALNCIYHEIDQLCQHKISNEELENVRSYLFGQLLRLLDGPFNSMEAFKSLYINGLDMNYFERYIDELEKITPEVILTMAQRYLFGGFTEIVVGKN